MLTRFNGVSLSKKGKSTPPYPYITFTNSVTRTEIFDTDTSYNVYFLNSSTNATLYNPQNITIYYVAIGSGGSVTQGTGSYGVYTTVAGGGGAGAFLEGSINIAGSGSTKTLTFSFGSSTNSVLTFPGQTITAGKGANATTSSGSSGSNGSSGSGGGAGGGSTTVRSGGAGNTPGFAGASGQGTGGANFGGGGGGAGSAASSSSGGLGKTISTTSKGINKIYTQTYCVGGSAGSVSKDGKSGSTGGFSTTFGSGGNSGWAQSNKTGQLGAIMLAISVNDIPSPIV
jgi:hypothetical protein